MSLYYKLDENKNAISCSLREWAEQLQDMRKHGTKHVGDENINGKRISTVWLGLNHNWDEDRTPHIFETMVFDENDQDIYCKRYATWKDAEEGHKEAIEWVKAGCHS